MSEKKYNFGQCSIATYQKNATPEQRSENAKKGAKASIESKRKRKAFKELLEIALTMENPDTGNTYDEDIVANLIKEAMSGKNSVNAFSTIRDSVGEKPSDKVEMSTKDTIKINIGEDK